MSLGGAGYISNTKWARNGCISEVLDNCTVNTFKSRSSSA